MKAKSDIIIRLATPDDADRVWEIFRQVIATGDTYVFDPAMPREDAMAYWFHEGTNTYVAVTDGFIAGTYILKPNQPGLGSHVANASFMVSSEARGLGLGRKLGEHCLEEARRHGYRAMQFNIVISTNTVAVKLWQDLGFEIRGTLPGVFRHARLGYTDAHVMFRVL